MPLGVMGFSVLEVFGDVVFVKNGVLFSIIGLKKFNEYIFNVGDVIIPRKRNQINLLLYPPN